MVVEPTPGIAAARNAALDHARDVDAVIFIDDDERPSEGWLDALVRMWRSSGADAVVGPVRSVFPHEPDPWILAGGFFDRRRLPDGAEVDAAATNNLLLDMRSVARLQLRFDADFGISGGSDTLFTRQLTASGGRIVWCASAMVTDVVPKARLNRRWVVRRAIRTGNSWSRVAVALEGSAIRRLPRRLTLTVQGLGRILGGLGLLVVGTATRSMARRARGVKALARGAGMTAGAWGYVYVEYRRAAS